MKKNINHLLNKIPAKDLPVCCDDPHRDREVVQRWDLRSLQPVVSDRHTVRLQVIGLSLDPVEQDHARLL